MTRPIAVRIEVFDVYKKYIPAICINHDAYQTGYYIRRLEVNREDILQIIPPSQDGDIPLPTLESIFGRVNPRFISVPKWTMEAMDGFMVFGNDLISNTGLHNVEYSTCLQFNIWKFYRIFDTIPKAAAPILEKQLKDLVSATDLASVYWYVSETRLFRAWILQKVKIYSIYARISWNEVLKDGYQQGNLVLYPIEPTFLGIEPAIESSNVRRIYNHEFSCNYYLRWFNHKDNQAQAIVYVTGDIQSEDHPTLSVPNGWYLFTHPRPTTNID